jgi:hypothetical protein
MLAKAKPIDIEQRPDQPRAKQKNLLCDLCANSAPSA